MTLAAVWNGQTPGGVMASLAFRSRLRCPNSCPTFGGFRLPACHFNKELLNTSVARSHAARRGACVHYLCACQCVCASAIVCLSLFLFVFLISLSLSVFLYRFPYSVLFFLFFKSQHVGLLIFSLYVFTDLPFYRHLPQSSSASHLHAPTIF